MNIDILYSAVDLVHASGHSTSDREAAFMRAYPILLTTARLPAATSSEAFLRNASLAFAWMADSLQPDMDALEDAGRAMAAASQEVPVIAPQLIEPIAVCLGSLVGATRVLHLVNPAVFPAWGERVEHFRLQAPPSDYHMSQTRNYLTFVQEVQEIAAHPLFLTFHHDYCTAYQARLQRLKIPAYPLTEPRVIETAAGELAGR